MFNGLEFFNSSVQENLPEIKMGVNFIGYNITQSVSVVCSGAPAPVAQGSRCGPVLFHLIATLLHDKLYTDKRKQQDSNADICRCLGFNFQQKSNYSQQQPTVLPTNKNIRCAVR